MQLSRYVVQTTSTKSETVLFNTVTRKFLPINSSMEELQLNFFLAGQEEQALRSVYAKQMPACAFSVVTTWQCNLRCTHCVVSHKLVANEDHELNIDKIADFIQRYATHHSMTDAYIHLIGGEGFLVVDRCLRLIDALSSINLKVSFQAVTNLAFELTDKHFELFSKLSNLAVSVDGLEEYYNKQRLAISGDHTYQLVLTNLKKLIFAGLKDKLTIQACIDTDRFTTDDMREYYRTMLQFGTPVLVSHILPSRKQPTPKEAFLQSIRSPRLVTQRCCKYRIGSLVIDYDENILSDYYSERKLGTLDDDIVVINNQQKLVNESAVVFTDPKCKSCPVVGYCWGGCSLIENTNRPLSEFCDQQALIEFVQQEAVAGNLIKGEQYDLHS